MTIFIIVVVLTVDLKRRHDINIGTVAALSRS